MMTLPKRSFRDYETYKKTFERLKPIFRILADRDLVPRTFYMKFTEPDVPVGASGRTRSDADGARSRPARRCGDQAVFQARSRLRCGKPHLRHRHGCARADLHPGARTGRVRRGRLRRRSSRPWCRSVPASRSCRRSPCSAPARRPTTSEGRTRRPDSGFSSDRSVSSAWRCTWRRRCSASSCSASVRARRCSASPCCRFTRACSSTRCRDSFAGSFVPISIPSPASSRSRAASASLRSCSSCVVPDSTGVFLGLSVGLRRRVCVLPPILAGHLPLVVRPGKVPADAVLLVAARRIEPGVVLRQLWRSIHIEIDAGVS